MRPRSPTAALALTVLALGCTSDPGDPPDPSVLLDADRAFAADVAESGADAWAAWFAEDGAMIQEGTGEVRGRAAIRETVAYLDRPGVSLTWQPDRADLAASGDLGWTTGSYTFRPAPDGPPGRGRYVSIWKRQPDGSWRVVMDLGVPVADGG
ncbi:MAG: YybH family protein [Candidatus Longimicrobiales bacterium M2_2A_002]